MRLFNCSFINQELVLYQLKIYKEDDFLYAFLIIEIQLLLLMFVLPEIPISISFLILYQTQLHHYLPQNIFEFQQQHCLPIK